MIQKRIKAQEGTTQVDAEANAPQCEDAATNVVDFMSWLQKRLGANRRTPAKRGVGAGEQEGEAAGQESDQEGGQGRGQETRQVRGQDQAGQGGRAGAAQGGGALPGWARHA